MVVRGKDELPTLARRDQLHPQVEEPEEVSGRASGSEVTVGDDPPV